MNRRPLMLLALAGTGLCLLSCVHSRNLSTPDDLLELNRMAADQAAYFRLTGGERRFASRVSVHDDSLFATSMHFPEPVAFPLDRVEYIQFSNTLEGARSGAMVGAVMGLLGGLVYSQSIGGGEYSGILRLVVLGVVTSTGSLGGLWAGAIAGKPERFMIACDDDSTRTARWGPLHDSGESPGQDPVSDSEP